MEKQTWQVDKKIPVALITTIAVQAVALIWAVASLYFKVEKHDQEINQIRNGQSEIRQLSDKLIRLEVLLESLNEKVDQVRKSKG